MKAQIMTQTTVLPAVETIFEWDAKWSKLNRQSRSHCLLRIFVDSEHDRAVVIASELHQNCIAIRAMLELEQTFKD